MKQLTDWLTEWKWLDKLPSTNFKIVVGAALAFLTAFFYFSMELLDKDLDSTNFIAWLAFVAAWAAISYRQYAKKRDSYVSPGPDSERAGVPATPAPQEPS